jgi:hypothetical protein
MKDNLDPQITQITKISVLGSGSVRSQWQPTVAGHTVPIDSGYHLNPERNLRNLCNLRILTGFHLRLVFVNSVSLW